MQAEKKRTEHILCVIQPYAQIAKKGGMPQFYIIQLYNPGDPKGGAMAQWFPPKYAPEAGPVKTFILGLGIDPKKKYHSIQLPFYFSVLR